MNRSLFRITAYLQLAIAVVLSSGCAPTQPFFVHETPDLQHYLNTATSIEYPDVDVESLAETTESMPPLAVGNHDYEFWDLTLEECVDIALQNSKFFVTTSGNAEFRQNVAAQFTSGTPDQFGSIYDVAIQQSTTQSIPLTVDSAGNRVLPRGVLRANQVGGTEDALAEFDAQASAFINWSTTDRLRNSSVIDPSNPTFFTQADDVTQQAAISKRIATGGVVTLRQQTIFARNNQATGGTLRSVPSDWTAILEAQIQHPLMRNRGTMVNRIPVVLASLNEDLAITDFEVQVRNLVRDVEIAYWDLYVAYRNLQTRMVGRDGAIATAYKARRGGAGGVRSEDTVAQAVEQYYQFRSQLEAALSGSNLPGDDRFGVYGRNRVLRELMGLAATDGRLIRPIDEPATARVEYDWDESVAQMLYLSPELRRIKTRVKQSELELISAKNQILPDVNLSLLYRWVGVGDHLGPPERPSVDAATSFPGSSALAELTSGDYQEGAIRLEITPPAFGARRELTRIRGAQWRKLREEGFLRDQERLLVSQLSDAFAKMLTHFQQVQSNAHRWQSAEVEVGVRRSQIENGIGDYNLLLQSQIRRAEAQIAYYRAVAEYNKSINYVEFLKGTSLATNSITLAEGPWNKKAYWDALERARERSAGKPLEYGVTRPGVVRRGPLRDAEAATQMVGNGSQFLLELPPESTLYEQHDPAAGLNLEPYREAVEVDDQPLSELPTPGEILGEGAAVDRIGGSLQSVAPSEASPAPAAQQRTAVRPQPLSDQPQIAPLSYHSEAPGPQPVRRKPVPGPTPVP